MVPSFAEPCQPSSNSPTMTRSGWQQFGLRRTEFNFAGQGVSDVVEANSGKIEFCTSEPFVE